MSIVGEARNGIEAISAIKRMRPDCAILDFQMPGANGLEVMRESGRWSPETRFVLITGQAKTTLLQDAIASGFAGVFLKDAPPESLLDALPAICGGATVIAPEVLELLGDREHAPGLTRREQEILSAIAKSQSNAQISESLGISHKTVETHRANLMKKLQVHSSASLIVRAFRDGLLDENGDLISR